MLIWEYCRVISVSYFRQGGLLAQISKLCASAPVFGARAIANTWLEGTVYTAERATHSTSLTD